MEKLSRAEFFSQLSIASAGFLDRDVNEPTRLETTHALLRQRSTIVGKEVGVDFYDDEQLTTMCHEAILADLAEQPLPSRVLSTFEFAWERYDALSKQVLDHGGPDHIFVAGPDGENEMIPTR